MEFESIEALALKKVSVAFDRSSISPGKYPVDFTLRVQGEVTVGKDYTQRIVAQADPWTLLASALSRLNGVTIECLVNEALSMDEALIEKVKTSATEAIQKIKDSTTTTCNGKVSVKLIATKE